MDAFRRGYMERETNTHSWSDCKTDWKILLIDLNMQCIMQKRWWRWCLRRVKVSRCYAAQPQHCQLTLSTHAFFGRIFRWRPNEIAPLQSQWRTRKFFFCLNEQIMNSPMNTTKVVHLNKMQLGWCGKCQPTSFILYSHPWRTFITFGWTRNTFINLNWHPHNRQSINTQLTHKEIFPHFSVQIPLAHHVSE